MPAIAKQRRVNRSKVLAKKGQRFATNSKIKPFNPLCGKLKSNNNLLAKSLSIQKQENQLLFSEKIRLTSQLQALELACNKRDIALANIHKNAKEMLTMLVTMTNHVTNTIMRCQEFTHKGDSTLQTNTPSAMRRESMKRFSTKSPARGVVKPMVSGHAITKPTINLRRINLQRINNLIDLSVIEEQSPGRINDSTMNSSRVHTTAFASTNRLGYEGERRRRLPERIPVEYVGVDDEEGGILGTQGTRLSERHSGRNSEYHGRERSGNTIVSPMQSPSVTLCDVSKLLQNSQTINIRLLQDLQSHEASNVLLNTPRDSSQHDDDGQTSSFNGVPEKLKKSCKNYGKKCPLSQNRKKSSSNEHDTATNGTHNQSETDDPIEGPSWLLNSSVVDSSNDKAEMEKVPKQKQVDKKSNSSDFVTEAEQNSDDSMEFTECVNIRGRPLEIPKIVSIPNRNDMNSETMNHHVQIKIKENKGSNAIDSNDSSSDSEDTNEQYTDLAANRSSEFVTDRHQHFVEDDNDGEDANDKCTSLVVNHSSQFVTDRRQNFIEDDDDEEDTIMLQLSKPRQAVKFNIHDFRLPVLNSPIVIPAELDESVPEVTTTLQKIPQNNEPPNLYDNNDRERVSNHHSLQLPNIDDAPEIKKTKCSTKKKTYKNIKYFDSDSSDSNDSDYMADNIKKTTKIVKDPSSAKVVLEKLTDPRMKKKSTNSNQNSLGRVSNPDRTNQRVFEFDNFDRTNDSSSSTNSTNGTCRPRRQKAPVNLKEPNLMKKLRRDV